LAQNNSIPPLPLSNKISSLAFPLAITGLVGEAREGRRTWATTVWSSMQHAGVMHLDFWKSQFHFTISQNLKYVNVIIAGSWTGCGMEDITEVAHGRQSSPLSSVIYFTYILNIFTPMKEARSSSMHELKLQSWN